MPGQHMDDEGYRRWLGEYVAVTDKGGVPYTREQYYARFFDGDTDPRAIYRQDVEARRELAGRGAIASGSPEGGAQDP